MLYTQRIFLTHFFLAMVTTLYSQDIVTIQNPSDLFLQNATTANSEQLEFSPSFYANGIVFASSRRKSGKKDEAINESFFELYYAEVDANGTPLKPRSFSMTVNSFLHEGPVTFNGTGDRIFFTRNNIQKGLQRADKKGVTRLKIYEAEKGKYDWENIKELSFNNDSYSCAHPTLSVDENKLFFASDRPGGFGGMDIWVVEKKGLDWGEPQNLGANINTPQNEVFPFMHASGNLFFATSGHNSKGGLDIFIANLEGNQVRNLGAPFNSSDDDLGLILTPDGKQGYFSSARAGGTGKDDIYFFESNESLFGVTNLEMIATKILVLDADNKAPVIGTEIRVFEKSKGGFLDGKDHLYEAILLPGEDDTNELVFKLVKKGADELGDPESISDEKGEVFFEFEPNKEYVVLATKDGYLAEELSISTVGKKGGMTIEVPLSKQTCFAVKGVVRNQENNKLLPRAVVKIWNECTDEEQELLTDKNGRFEYCAQDGCDYVIKGFKENYQGAFLNLKHSELKNMQEPLEIMLTPTNNLTGIMAGSIIVLENIYYDFNKSYIRAGAARELDELSALMNQYPSMVIELVSHTDSRGETNYNLNLSQKRADAAKEYLTARGIDASRIRALGFGESQLRNKCVDGIFCSEEEHQFNRRTEVRVISIDSPVNIRYGNNAPGVVHSKQ